MKAIFAIATILTTALFTACFSDTRFTTSKFAVSGKPMRLAFFWSLNPDCTVRGVVTVRMLKAPQHGQLTIEAGPGYSRFRPTSQWYQCNLQQTQGVVVSYISNPGYAGNDSATIEFIDPDGGHGEREYAITVK